MNEALGIGAGSGGSIRWRDWSEETFAEARRDGKLVFLDISATWCHWCHVLDRTTLSDPRVVRRLDESFVAVRVDTDRRPDVNDRYNQGGWPTTAVLLPGGQLLAGATYLPADAMLALLSRCADFYARDRERIEERLRHSAGSGFDREEDDAPRPSGPRAEDLALVRHAVTAQYDPEHPGFFREPKFLMTEALGFLRDCWLIGSDRETGETFLKILETIGASAVCDPVDGGIFRYATRRDWTVPHYEKLLSDNAEMLSLYASAFERTGDPSFAAPAEGILRFLLLRLHDPSTGAFFASRDADEEYYSLTAKERALRLPPPADRTLFSEYNARAASALVAAHRAFASGKAIPDGAGGSLLERAGRIAAFLRDGLWSDEEGQIRYREGNAAFAGHLADNVAAATAFLDLFDAAGDPSHLAQAATVLDGTVRRFYSAGRAGFLDRRPGKGDIGALSVPLVPFAGNAMAAMALIRCGRAAGRTDLLALGREAIRGLSGRFERRGAFAAPYGSALLLLRQADPGPACLPGDPSCRA